MAIVGDRLATVGPQASGRGGIEIDAAGLAVAPGFINMLSWAVESLIADGRSQSDIRRGVTLEHTGALPGRVVRGRGYRGGLR